MAAALAAAAVLAALARAIGFEDVFLGDRTVVFAFGDAFYHARRALFSFENFPRLLLFDRCINYPDGSVVPHPPLLDWAVAGAARLGATSRAGFERVLAWSPVVFGALTVLPVAALGRALGRPRVGLAAAALYAALPITVSYSRVGNADHHAAAGLLGACVLAATAGALDPDRRGRRLAATFAAQVALRLLLLGTWAGGLLYLGPATLAALAAGALAGRRALLAAETVASAATAVVLAPAVALLPPPNGGPWSGTELSFLHVLFFAGAGLLALEARAPAATPARRALRAAALGAGLAAAALLLLPGLAGGLARAAGFLGKADAYTESVVEQMPLFWEQGELRAAAGERRLGAYAYALPLLPLLFAGLLPGARLAARRAFLFGWSLLFALLALQQHRYAHDAAPAASVGFALALAAGAHALRARGVGPRAAAAAAAALGALLLAPAVPRYYAPNAGPTLRHLLGRDPAGDRALASLGGTQLRFAQRVAAATPPTPGCDASDARPAYGILAHPAIGHVLHYAARRATPADPLGPYVGEANYARTRRFLLSESEEEVVGLAARLETPYLLTAEEGGGPSATVAWRLQREDGVASDARDHLGRFRLVVEGPRGGIPIAIAFGAELPPGPPYKLFEVVAGAQLLVAAPPGERVEAELAVATGAGRRFRFRAAGRAEADGWARLRVPYATGARGAVRTGPAWRVRAGGREIARAVVSDADVRTGAALRVEAGP